MTNRASESPTPREARLARLVDRHGGALVLYARQLCDAPDDVVQEAFCKLAAATAEPERPLAWLYRVVRNGAISARRSATRRRRHEREAATGRQTWFTGSIDDLLDSEAVVDALETLAARDREIVVAAVWGGLSFEEIGDLVGTGRSTAHRRYHAALKQLRSRLETPCPLSRATPRS